MTAPGDGLVRAILGPTNTGKTHLAIERMCAHSSGVIGFPLRLLAREVYDRVVAMKGANSVALLTGEERIVPTAARYWLCTAESMPVGQESDQRDFAFAAIDEAQLGIDPERGHVFTDRMLRARGREETLILGSESLKPLVRKLLPRAEVITRPRFSTLRYAGSTKLTRLPPRSAIVAFSAEQVYGLAEMLRRFKGGAAVVMGSLSPATRNAQVAMFQRGEVDYLVATDAIGMGLNMDVTHVAFAGLEKFDGRRDRRLTIAEMAQIAGRAGRHQKDGTFGTLGLGGEAGAAFSEQEIEAIEEHRFRPLEALYWRNPELDFTDVRSLIASLETPSGDPLLRSAPIALDLTVLKSIAEDPAIVVRKGRQARALWAACGLPDFRKVGPMHHGRMVRRIYSYIGEGGHIPHEWFAAEVTRLDNVAGDIEAIADRLAGIRSWAYIAQRGDWLKDPAKWADRTKSVEARLSDALHAALTQRFVDRRTAVLVRDIGARGADALPVTVAADGEVSVGPEPIGHLAGFSFTVDPTARLADKRLLLAAAERRLGDELDRRAKALCETEDSAFSLTVESGGAIGISWEGHLLARLAPGRSLLEPAVRTARPLDRLSAPRRAALRSRLEAWLERTVSAQIAPLKALARTASDKAATPGVRAVAAMLADAGGVMPRKSLTAAIGALDKTDRHALHGLKVRLGALDVFVPTLLKPAAQHLRAALAAVRAGQPLPRLAPPGAATLDGSADPRGAMLAYRRFGSTWLRIDLADRITSYAHSARAAGKTEPIDPALITSLGLDAEGLRKLMAEIGFVPAGTNWRWRGRRPDRTHVAPPRPGNAFAALTGLHPKR
jgi:ATP-dependent RNA helicase SUPV3L1/SUV3